MENAGSNADPHTHEAHDSIMRSHNIWIKILISINLLTILFEFENKIQTILYLKIATQFSNFSNNIVPNLKKKKYQNNLRKNHQTFAKTETRNTRASKKSSWSKWKEGMYKWI